MKPKLTLETLYQPEPHTGLLWITLILWATVIGLLWVAW